jgi:hypothetical protein
LTVSSLRPPLTVHRVVLLEEKSHDPAGSCEHLALVYKADRVIGINIWLYPSPQAIAVCIIGRGNTEGLCRRCCCSSGMFVFFKAGGRLPRSQSQEWHVPQRRYPAKHIVPAMNMVTRRPSICREWWMPIFGGVKGKRPMLQDSV